MTTKFQPCEQPANRLCRHRRVWLPVMLTLLSSGCAQITTARPVVTETILSRKPTEQFDDDEAYLRTRQTGLQVEILAMSVCRKVERLTIRIDHRAERQSENKGRDWLYGITGGVLLGAGAAIVIDSPRVGSSALDSRVYNSTDGDKALYSGLATAGVGLGLLGVAIVDAIRASGAEETSRTEKRDGDVGEAYGCADRFRKHLPISLRVRGHTLPLGTTDERGRLTFSLEKAIPIHLPGDEQHAEVSTGSAIATVDLVPLLRWQDDKGWGEAGVETCRQPSRTADCSGVAEYERRFPNGAHADEARALLAAARGKLAALEDDETWRDANEPGCAAPKGPDEGVESSCYAVQRYLDTYPRGRHVDPARRALARRDRRLAETQKRRERKERDDAAAEARRRAAAERAARTQADAERETQRTKKHMDCLSKCKSTCADEKNVSTCTSTCSGKCP